MDIPIHKKENEIKIKKTHFCCSKCGKTFRNEEKYNDHVIKQLCIKKEDRTYCEVCDICLPNKKKFIKHKITPLHYMNIKRMDIEEFEIPNNEKEEADPYLNKNDCQKMKQSYGDGISICFNNSDLLDIQFDEEADVEEEESQEESQEEDKQGFVVSERQQKILTFLKKMENIPDNDKKFLQSLSKLNLDDYKGLITAIISEENIAWLPNSKSTISDSSS